MNAALLSTKELYVSAGLSRGQLAYLRELHPEKFPPPVRLGTTLLWPTETLEIVKELLLAVAPKGGVR